MDIPAAAAVGTRAAAGNLEVVDAVDKQAEVDNSVEVGAGTLAEADNSVVVAADMLVEEHSREAAEAVHNMQEQRLQQSAHNRRVRLQVVARGPLVLA